VDISLAGIAVCRRGREYPFHERVAHRKMLAKYVPIVVDLRYPAAAGLARGPAISPESTSTSTPATAPSLFSVRGPALHTNCVANLWWKRASFLDRWLTVRGSCRKML
jgi:hypothetical protein